MRFKFLMLVYFQESSNLVFLLHLSRRLNCTIVITRCPSSVRPSLTFHIFNFSSQLSRIQENLTGSKISMSSTKFVFLGRSENQDGGPCLWLAETFSTSKLLNRIQRNMTVSKISTSSTKFVFFVPIEKKNGRPCLLIGWGIFDFSSETAGWNSTKLDLKQYLNVLYKVCVFGADRQNQDGTRPLIGWDIFDFASETTEHNSTKLDRKQNLNVLYKIYDFSGRSENKMPLPLIGWGILVRLTRCPSSVVKFSHFRLLLWNHWTEFNETWQEARF